MTTAPDTDAARLARALFPDLAAELDAALARHGGARDDDARFDAWLDGETDRLRTATSGLAFGDALTDAARDRLARDFAAARAVAAAAGLRVPEPEAYAAAGVDLAALGAALDADPTLAAVPAPAGLGADGWRALYAAAAPRSGGRLVAAGETGDADPADGREAPPQPLVFAAEVEREFALLDRAPEGAPVVAAATPGRPLSWSLRLVPAGLAPAVLGLSYAHGPHATLPEMLMLQAARAVGGGPLVDARSFTWLAGPLAEGRLAARHVYDADEHAVRINCREVGNQGPHLGARPPLG